MVDPVGIAERLSVSGAFEHLSPPVQTALFLGVMALVPMALVTLTSFTRIVIVLGFVRRAVTAQEIPPNMVLTGLSLFLTLFVMEPVWQEMSQQAISPYLDKKLPGPEALRLATHSLEKFMVRQTRRQDLALFIHLSGIEPPHEASETPFRVLVPAFVISELKTAFIMGFLIYMPFLLVDLVV